MKIRNIGLGLWSLGLLFLPQIAWAQDGTTADLSLTFLLSTVVYGILGIGLYIASYFIFDRVFGLDLQRELVEDQNIAIGIMMAGVFVGIAILISAVID